MTEDFEGGDSALAPLPCSRCAAMVAPGRGAGYLVEIRAVADPTPPVFLADEVASDASREIRMLLLRLGKMTSREVAEQVFRRKMFWLCGPCYREWIADPFAR